MVKKTVLITETTGTIGKVTALELARNNCHLIILSRNSEKLERAKTKIQTTTGNQNIDFVLGMICLIGIAHGMNLIFRTNSFTLKSASLKPVRTFPPTWQLSKVTSSTKLSAE